MACNISLYYGGEGEEGGGYWEACVMFGSCVIVWLCFLIVSFSGCCRIVGSLWSVWICFLWVCVGCLGDLAYCFVLFLPALLLLLTLPLLHNTIDCDILECIGIVQHSIEFWRGRRRGRIRRSAIGRRRGGRTRRKQKARSPKQPAHTHKKHTDTFHRLPAIRQHPETGDD